MLRMCRDFVSVSLLRIRGKSRWRTLENSQTRAHVPQYLWLDFSVTEVELCPRTRRGVNAISKERTLLFLTMRPIVFQDIDGDIGGAYARVSLHPAGAHCEIAHPLNVENHRGRCRRRKDAEHRGSARSCQWHMGLGHTLVFSLQIDTLAKRNKTHDSEKGYRERKGERERERKRVKERERKRHTQYVLT